SGSWPFDLDRRAARDPGALDAAAPFPRSGSTSRCLAHPAPRNVLNPLRPDSELRAPPRRPSRLGTDSRRNRAQAQEETSMIRWWGTVVWVFVGAIALARSEERRVGKG